MMHRAWLALLCAACAASLASAGSPAQIRNPAIDMEGYLRFAKAAAAERETHRVSEDEFIRMSREPGTIVLDARSLEKYDELHVRGAINLAFPDITVASLKDTIPEKTTRILIYCNNNFSNAAGAFPEKLPPASLNLLTYIALYTYGYRNVYELGPYVDIGASRLEFESSCAHQACDRTPAEIGREERTLGAGIAEELRGR
jgi:phage shock protein E